MTSAKIRSVEAILNAGHLPVGLVYAAIRKLPTLPNHADYEDLVGVGLELMVKAMKTHDPNKGALSAHIWWTVRYGLVDYLRTKKPVSFLDDAEWELLPAFGHYNPEGVVVSKVYAEQVRQAVYDLPLEAREIALALMEPRGGLSRLARRWQCDPGTITNKKEHYMPLIQLRLRKVLVDGNTYEG